MAAMPDTTMRAPAHYYIILLHTAVRPLCRLKGCSVMRSCCWVGGGGIRHYVRQGSGIRKTLGRPSRPGWPTHWPSTPVSRLTMGVGSVGRGRWVEVFLTSPPRICR